MAALTISIPSYRQPALLERALRALSSQSFKDFKVVILDDASGIDFTPIIEKFPELNTEIIHNEKNLGAMKNMLASIMFQTTSPYILSHHEDDFLKSNYLECAMEILEKDQTISFVATTPAWITKDAPYKQDLIKDKTYITFSASEFAHRVLTGTPLMFGSVVYRKSHLIPDWHFDTYATFCDRYFLGEILESHHSLGALVQESGIFVRDHSLDKEDSRGDGTTEDHAINLFAFYKRLLIGHYPMSTIKKVITNGLLFTYSNFPTRSALLTFYQKQKKEHLLSFSHLSRVGLFALFTLHLSPTAKRLLLKGVKGMVK